MKRTNENIVSSFFYYMWNRWSKAECETVFGNMAGHFWAKWCGLSSATLSGAAERFYAELGNNARDKSWNGRANSMTGRGSLPKGRRKMKAKSTYANVAVPVTFRYGHGSMVTRMNTFRTLMIPATIFGAIRVKRLTISSH